jgi:hypothetical protein
MRDSSAVGTGINTSDNPATGTVETTKITKILTSQFCHVCRYSLVDQIDPYFHGKIDKAYDKIYPKIGFSTLEKVGFWSGIIVVAVAIGYALIKYDIVKLDDE